MNSGCCDAGSEVTDMCEQSSRTVQSGHLVTPFYPEVYPTNVNCLCRLQVDRPAARLRLTFYDLALETKDGRCQADWIMLRQRGKPIYVALCPAAELSYTYLFNVGLV